MCLSQYGRTDQCRNWVLFRFRPNGDDPDTCLYDVMFLHRYPEGEEPTVEHEWYPTWDGHDDWGASIGQDLSNMGHVQAGMHQSTCKGPSTQPARGQAFAITSGSWTAHVLREWCLCVYRPSRAEALERSRPQRTRL
jgi:hypothetical protein